MTRFPTREMTSMSVSDRLVLACQAGNLSAVQAAVANGAKVNRSGKRPGWLLCQVQPLAEAATEEHFTVVRWLLSVGADPNGEGVMEAAACYTSPDILQVLVDAGGDVNVEGGFPRRPVLSWVSLVNDDNAADKARVLLAEPSLDLSCDTEGRSPQQFADARGALEAAELIGSEVGTVEACSQLLYLSIAT